jgi:hypothetical protein
MASYLCRSASALCHSASIILSRSCYHISRCSFTVASVSSLLLSSSIWAYKIAPKYYNRKTKLWTNQRKTNEKEITWSACMVATEVSGRGRMGGVESMVLARSWERVGVLAVSTTLSVSQYRPCFFPPPAIIMAFPERGAVAESHVSLCSAVDTYRQGYLLLQ